MILALPSHASKRRESPAVVTQGQASQISGILSTMANARHRPSLYSMGQLALHVNSALQSGAVDGNTAVQIVEMVRTKLATTPNLRMADIESLRRQIRPKLSRLPRQQLDALDAAAMNTLRSAYPELR